MKKLLSILILSGSLSGYAQVYPTAGISFAGNTSTEFQGGAELGLTYDRLFAAVDYKYGTYNKMNSIGAKVGACAWLDYLHNEGLYLIGGVSYDTWNGEQTTSNGSKTRLSDFHPSLVVRWWYYNAYFDIGRANYGWVMTIGWNFKNITWVRNGVY